MITHAQRIEEVIEQNFGPSDADTIRKLRRELSQLRSALTAANQENEILREELAQARQAAEMVAA